MHVEQKILSVVSVKTKFLLHVDVRILHAILVFVNMHFSIQMRNKLCSYQLREEQWWSNGANQIRKVKNLVGLLCAGVSAETPEKQLLLHINWKKVTGLFPNNVKSITPQ